MTPDRRRVLRLRREVARLQAIIKNCAWYWNVDDREYSASDPTDLLDEAGPGNIMEIERGGVVETKFYFFIENADGDRQEFAFDTLEEAEETLASKK